MWSSQAAGKTLRLVAAAACFLVLAAATPAREKEVAGEYICVEARVAGKSVPCKAATLSLKTDGKFELEGREGEYLVNGNWVELDGKALKSRAKIEKDHKIAFRFYNKKGLCEIIYERRVVQLGKTQLG